MSKHALKALGQSIAREYSAKGVHVCHVRVDCAIDSEKAKVAARKGLSVAGQGEAGGREGVVLELGLEGRRLVGLGLGDALGLGGGRGGHGHGGGW
eukprot:CAMPEP_0180068762 /NCGR_PEP_ID=MMETSP0985-20121206/10615_1 /TAXON_ID=483367 /ORGANISM="non described non described, Strain CCMP 2436" /LENGTH=95 /DNA_ID=CAMNT_0021999607 /DNA_START=442 /DNA_END=726 /DNA_ORIENTATION=+